MFLRCRTIHKTNNKCNSDLVSCLYLVIYCFTVFGAYITLDIFNEYGIIYVDIIRLLMQFMNHIEIVETYGTTSYFV